MATTRTARTAPTTTRTARTAPTTTRTARPKTTIWIDYLLDHLGEQILDDTGDAISIYSTSGYEQVDSGTVWTKRTPI